MQDLELAIKFTGDGKGLRGEVNLSRKDIAALNKELSKTQKSGKDAADGLDQAGDETEELGDKSKKSTGLLSKMRSVIAGFALVALIRNIFNTNKEFQSLRATLITATGSLNLAKQAFSAIQAFAAKTPFSVQELTDAFIRLTNLGLTPSERAMTSYGNTAGALGTSLNQMIEAVADAATGEFERLKEFGIKARSEGDKVTFTFKGIATTVEKEAAAIEGYLISLGETHFGDGMEQQANVAKGAISNLGDAWDNLKDKLIPEEGEGALTDGIRLLSDGLNWLADVGIKKFQKAFVTSLGGIEKAFNSLNTVSQIVWEGIKASADGAINIIKENVGGLLEGLADAVLFLEPGARNAQKLKEWASNLGDVGSAYEAFEKKAINLRKELAVQNAVIDQNINQTRAQIDANQQESVSLDDVVSKMEKKTAVQYESAKAAAELHKASEERLQTEFKSLEAIEKAIEKEQLHLESIGLTKSALADLEIQRLNDAAATLERRAAIAEATSDDASYIETLKIEAEALRELAELKEQSADRQDEEDAAEDVADANEEAMKRIERDTERAFERGQDIIERWARTGKLDIQSLVDFATRELNRLFDQQQATQTVSGGSLGGLVGGLFGGGFSAGSAAEFDAFDSAPFDAIGADGINIGNLFGFGTGGIMTKHGPMKLERFGDGGVVNSPTIFEAGERYQTEAIVPLPDGRSIPVDIRGESGSNSGAITFAPVSNFYGSGLTPTEFMQLARQASEESLAKFQRQIQQGGRTTQLVARR